jgi:hypothetical protein
VQLSLICTHFGKENLFYEQQALPGWMGIHNAFATRQIAAPTKE